MTVQTLDRPTTYTSNGATAPPTERRWETDYDDSARETIAFCRHYIANATKPLLPGHHLMHLIATMASHLDELHHSPTAVPAESGSTTRRTTSGPPATDKQVRAIYAIGTTKAHLTDTEIEERCQDVYGLLPHELTKQEASQ